MSPGKVALVTGANKGIGKEIARGLAEKGVTVLLGARDTLRGEAAAEELATSGRVLFQQIDVTSDASVAAAVQRVDTDFGQLDILVNNAGISIRAMPSDPAMGGIIRTVYEVNVFGLVRVTNAFLPLLHKAPAAMVVNITSKIGSLSDPAITKMGTQFMAYTTSKTAVTALTTHYANELAGTTVKINAVCPGHCATDLNRHSGPMTPTQGAEVPIRIALMGADGPHGQRLDSSGDLPF